MAPKVSKSYNWCMRRLEQGEGNSPAFTMRLPQQMKDLLDELVEKLPRHPIVGAPERMDVIRAAIDAGIPVLAQREGVKLNGLKKTGEKRSAEPRETRRSKTSDGRSVDVRSRARAEKRAAARLAAGCTCTHSHVRTCKLYSRHSSAA